MKVAGKAKKEGGSGRHIRVLKRNQGNLYSLEKARLQKKVILAFPDQIYAENTAARP